MSIWEEMSDNAAKLFKQWLADESQLTADQLMGVATYLLKYPDIGYELAYRKATPEQKLEIRERTNKLFAAGIAKAVARKAARKEMMLKIIQMVIGTALMAVSKELE